MKINKTIEIKNRKARFEYEILDKYHAGIVLGGTEIKAIRLGKASIAEAFCEFKNNELWIINMTGFFMFRFRESAIARNSYRH